MEAPSPRTTVIVGGKGTSLPAPHSVYDVSHGAALVQIDTPALDRLFQFARTPTPALLPPPESPAFDKNQLMSRIEARATLFVLLNKLLQGQARIRPFIPIFLGKILNHFIHLDLPLSEGNAGVSVAIVDSIYKFKKAFACTHELDSSFDVSKPALELFKSRLLESNAGEPGVTKDELETLDAAVAPGPAIAALSIHLSSSICMASDVIAALSCEALQLNTQAFEAETSGESVSYKAENDVASDLRTLLFGSKLVNLKSRGIDPDFISSIPSTHGCLREDLKLASSRARIEINSASLSKRKPSTAVPDSVSASPLAKSLLCVLLDMESVVSHSVGRLAQVLQAIRDADATSVGFEKDESGLLKFEEASQTHLESLKKLLSTMVSKLPDKDYLGVTFSSEAYTAMRGARKILASEAVAALTLLHVCDCLLTGKKAIGAVAKEDKSCDQGSDNSLQNGSIESSQSLKDGKGIQVHDKKKKKGGREMILGRGTSFVRQSFMSVIEQKFPTNNLLSYFGWLQVVEEFLDPKNTEFQSFLDGVKVILECNEARRLPQVPKGTRDFTPEQMAIREKAFGIIASVFKRHGAVAIDTPVFELRETLMGKYGEDSKLIFDLADQGGQICSLRYDLTVPFARYLAMNSVSNLKRYHIARVYRRDNPSKGRYREFYQCDFDIAGNYASMVPDFEVIEVLTEMLDELDIGDYQIKLNHRGLLDGMLDICGVPKGKFRTICSAIDKLDKVPWELVRKEMIEEKGLTEQAADKIGEFVKFSGAPLEVLQTLKAQGSPFLEHIGSSHALEDLATLFRYLKAADCLHRVVFDLSLARGLDYYTGVIYEAVFVGSNQVGSIAAGGRYDNLVGMFSGKQVPAVGVSLGIERVFTIMEQKVNDQKQMIRATQTEVLVVVLGEDMEVAIKLVKELWTGRIRAEFVCVSPRKFQKQLEYALDKGIPWMIVVGNDELEKGVVRLQDLASKQRNDIPRSDIVGELQRRGFRKELDFHPVFQ